MTDKWQPSRVMTDEEFAQANANMPTIEKYHAMAQDHAKRGCNSAARAFIKLTRQAMVGMVNGGKVETAEDDNRLNVIFFSLIDIEIEVK